MRAIRFLAVACYLPKSIGRCRKSVPSFFYNHETGSCEEFNYGGCKGNKNRFETAEDCESNCTLPLTPGTINQYRKTITMKGKKGYYSKGKALYKRNCNPKGIALSTRF